MSYTADVRLRDLGDETTEEIIETGIQLDGDGMAELELDKEPGHYEISSRLVNDQGEAGSWDPWRHIQVPQLIKTSDGYVLGLQDH